MSAGGTPGLAGERALVLGATGFVGRWVVRLLERRGAEVVPHARDERRAQEVLADLRALERLAVADLAEPDRPSELFRSVRPSVVFNLVGYGVDRKERDEATAYRINGSLVGDLCRATARHGHSGRRGPRFVHVGSALEYGEASGDLSENTTPRPTTVYGRSKLVGTLRLRRYCERTGTAGLTARLFTVFGPGEHGSRLLPSLLAAAHSGSAVELTEGRQHRDFTYVEDVADGLLRLAGARSSPGAVVNLATGRLTSVRDFVLEAAPVLGLSSEQLRFGALPTREEEMAHDPVSIRRLEELTGWRPRTSIREGVRRTLERSRSGPSANDARADGGGAA